MSAKRAVPKKIELVFDSIYLCSVMMLGLYFVFGARKDTMWLWGVMALLLGGGDAFHLLPRMAAVYTGKTNEFVKAMGIGKLITSVTMTIFYILLWHNALLFLGLELSIQTAVLYVLAGARIVLCLLPQNKWKEGGEGHKMGIYRNVPFLIQGLLVVWVYAKYGNQMPGMQFVWLAILISFVCYIPVVLWVTKYPKLGMLMLPKTCAYLWIISMGLSF